jgi:dTDP-glucose 4,6-dehydratase
MPFIASILTSFSEPPTKARVIAYKPSDGGEILKILVTGGAGFIGSNFVRRTLETRPSTQLVVLDSLTYAGRRSNLSGLDGQIDFVEGDIRDSELVDQLVKDVETVVHFAAESHNDNSLVGPRIFLDTNVLGTFEIIQACVKHSVRLHHVSTDEVFGDLPRDSKEKFSVETPYNPSSPYSASKAASDMLVRAWTRSFGLEATISNCSNNYGPYQHEEKLIPITIFRALRGLRPKVYGDGLNIRDWIHVDDHTDGLWSILDKGRSGETYLLGSNGERTNLQVVTSILSELKLGPDFLEFVPDRAGHDERYAIDFSRTHEELGWFPKLSNFEDGISKVVAHYVSSADSGRVA